MKQLLKISLLVAVVGTLSYAFHQISHLTQRLETIERRLGGSAKAGCSEAETIERVRRSVVRIIGGESCIPDAVPPGSISQGKG